MLIRKLQSRIKDKLMSLSLLTESHSHQLGIGGIDICDKIDKIFFYVQK